MENCCTNLCGVFNKLKRKEDWPEKININKNTNKLVVLKEPTGREIGLRYELGRELGRGEFGITYLCKDRQTGEELACKSISKNKLRTAITAIDIEDLRRQVEIMRHLPKHPNIVSLKYTYEDEHDVHLVMELCEGGGDLLHRIVSEGYYTERSAASVIKTVVQVVQMCHKHGVMHRNLKLENFLFADKTETGPLKLADFHLSIFFQPGERMNQMVGSSYYMAPEVLKRNYGPEIDIWSAGVILYFLLCGFPPFWAETEEGVSQAIIDYVVDFKRDPWPHVSVNAKDLVKKMLEPDPDRRITAQEVLDHSWLTEHVKEKFENAKDIVMNMLTAHDVLGHPWLLNPNTAPNVSLGETVRRKLLQFSVMNQLTNTTSRVIAQHLYEEELWVMDTGTNGFITQEVRQRLYRLGQQNPDVNVQRLVNAFHVNRDGYLDYGRFLDISVHLRKRSHEEHVDRAFQFFDKKQSGYIELEEFRKALAETDKSDTESQKVINAIMHDVATNKDGRISYEEITNRSLKLMKEWSIKIDLRLL